MPSGCESIRKKKTDFFLRFSSLDKKKVVVNFPKEHSISVEYLRDSNSNSDDQYYHEAWDSDAVCFSSASRVSVAFTVSALSLILAFFSVSN